MANPRELIHDLRSTLAPAYMLVRAWESRQASSEELALMRESIDGALQLLQEAMENRIE